ncbi:MAG: ATP-binding cassette domain-containing protein [Flavobacteriia bacterium]
MSERILRALMQLFAIIAQVDDQSDSGIESATIRSSKGKRIITSFLQAELSSVMVQKYLDLFDDYLNNLHSKSSRKDKERKRTSLNSVKILRICVQINEELTQKQKIIVLIRIIEFIQSNENVTEQEVEFVNTVAEAFNISKLEYDLITDFVLSSNVHRIDSPDILYVYAHKKIDDRKQLLLEGLDDEIRMLKVKSINTLFFRYFGKDELSINGQFVFNDRTHIFTQGSTLRTQKSKHLYYSDVISQFFNLQDKQRLTFKADSIAFDFKGGKKGLFPFTFTEESGKLVGIMGGSGTGKSTLLNILNGNYRPTSGSVTINGVDVHREKVKLEGIIGFVSQDDLLIEELSVFQNLYFNAKLCFADLSDMELKRRVIELLQSIGLYEVRDLVVGTPLEKSISGGQRKRLNIALELIREPEVLFVDEPTSGLSSRDSENIMDLMKELTFKGKLIFVVIHQPSSDIFKMFDRLFLMDQGGYPIFDGNPIDSIVYFKHHIHHGDADERECSLCGNVNPEQLFNIIDTKIVDEYGNLTDYRKTSPGEWYQMYQEYQLNNLIQDRKDEPRAQSKIPSKTKQFSVYFKRDFLSKMSNVQYMLITFLEAPALALILSFFVKFFGAGEDGSNIYSFYRNENIPQYLFISIVVSLFLGLTVAAEEIHKDKRILARESFLNLSRGSYLTSKIYLLFIISAIQSLLFVLVGNLVLEIKNMWFEYWLILFSTSCAANILGLNISSGFNSAKVIYIVVPILIIPQLLFSGVIVKFDKLHPIFSKSTEVPWIGNLMISRWSYEAMAVTQSAENALEKDYFEMNCKKYDASWKKDYWIPEMQQNFQKANSTQGTIDNKLSARNLLMNEISKEEKKWANLTCKNCVKKLLSLQENSDQISTVEIDNFIQLLKIQYTKTSNEQSEIIDLKKNLSGEKSYNLRRDLYVNEALNDIVTNRLETNKIITYEEELFRKDNPVYHSAKNSFFFNAHFYAPEKNFFGIILSTFWSNTIILWCFSIFFFISLYFDWLRKSLDFLEYWKNRFKKKAAQ